MPPRVTVVVLGDLGHSPRMQYHCLSLAQKGINVDFIGYGGSEPQNRLITCPQITVRYLSECPPLPLPSIFGLFFKLIWQTITLMYVLSIAAPRMDVILLQNPPGLPALFVCWLIAKCRRCRFLIDWHNYTHSIFALRYGPDNFFVQLVKRYEFFFGTMADGGFCVTEAMKSDLAARGISVLTHYDRPASVFRPLSRRERLEFLTDLSRDIPELNELTSSDDQQDLPSPSAKAMLISSTSWTPDEDFDVLLSALKLYDVCNDKNSDVSRNDRLPELLVVVTGKGPLKEQYKKKARDYGFRKITLVTPWLKAEDYPKMLACSDLGVSLHFSSSGLDLPMKVVDMQGCALPVVSRRFRCIGELVEHGRNGFTFDTEQELFELLKLLLRGYSKNGLLTRTKATCLELREKNLNWDEAWNSVVCPYLEKYL